MMDASKGRGVESLGIGMRFHTLLAAEACLYDGDHSGEIPQYKTIEENGQRKSVVNPEWADAEFEIGLFKFHRQTESK